MPKSIIGLKSPLLAIEAQRAFEPPVDGFATTPQGAVGGEFLPRRPEQADHSAISQRQAMAGDEPQPARRGVAAIQDPCRGARDVAVQPQLRRLMIKRPARRRGDRSSIAARLPVRT